MMNMAYLRVAEDGIIARRSGVTDKAEFKFRTVEALIEWLDRNGMSRVMCSSSLDFPEEFTSDPAIIKLAEALRNA